MNLKKVCLAVLFFAVFSAVSQEIDPDYKTRVDSFVKATDKNKSLYEGTKEGEIYQADKIIGEYTTHPLLDKVNDKLYRLKYIEDTDTNTTTTYYYLENELVFATVKRKIKKGRRTLTKATYYYKDKTLLSTSGMNAKEEEGKRIIEQADRAQREFYQTWFKDEKP
jgi:hypothetical protein